MHKIINNTVSKLNRVWISCNMQKNWYTFLSFIWIIPKVHNFQCKQFALRVRMRNITYLFRPFHCFLSFGSHLTICNLPYSYNVITKLQLMKTYNCKWFIYFIGSITQHEGQLLLKYKKFISSFHPMHGIFHQATCAFIALHL